MFSYNIWHYVQKINFKFVQYNQYWNTAPLLILSVISPRTYPLQPYTIHHITIYLSCIYHIAITYLSHTIHSTISLYTILCNQIYYCYALYYYILYQHAYKKYTCIQIQAWNIFYNLKYHCTLKRVFCIVSHEILFYNIK